LALSGVNTYTGDTTLIAGTLLLSTGNECPNTTVNMAGGSLAFGASTALLGGLKGSGDLTLANGVGLVVGLNHQSTNHSGVMSGTGMLVKSGNGTLTLNGANTYTGDTVVSGGVLKLGNSLACKTRPSITPVYGGALSFGTLTSAVLGSLKGGQYLPLANESSQPVTLSIGNNAQSTTYSGRLDGAGGLTKDRERHANAQRCEHLHRRHHANRRDTLIVHGQRVPETPPSTWPEVIGLRCFDRLARRP